MSSPRNQVEGAITLLLDQVVHVNVMTLTDGNCSARNRENQTTNKISQAYKRVKPSRPTE